MPLFQNVVLNTFLSGVDEKKVELGLTEEAE
ncbi:hypothetical protein SAMN06265219_10148 [Gracilimonas mengyeensis]|uniref:Uncharacterized protein n=1 Tax=Gracilimonas mengyeensis TaxID=1302730 RepID=A0A521AC82_9BACT|nr:hypothetical protein SAMN06265219_10148 [Gracilimonas mengyeensis]